MKLHSHILLPIQIHQASHILHTYPWACATKSIVQKVKISPYIIQTTSFMGVMMISIPISPPTSQNYHHDHIFHIYIQLLTSFFLWKNLGHMISNPHGQKKKFMQDQ